MDALISETWQEIFERAAEAKETKRREQDMKVFYETIDREKHHKEKVKEKEEKETKELEEVAATAAQLAAFTQRLDDYDTTTVHALMQNGEALDRVSADLRRMLDDAYVLSDGRRVFKAEDGRRVFDEHGAELTGSVDPALINNARPRWETFATGMKERADLQTERQGLIDFQAKLDDARTRVGKGEISKRQLDDLDADLKASAPPAVRQKLGLAVPETDADAKPRPDQLTAAQQRALIEDLSRHAQPQPAPM